MEFEDHLAAAEKLVRQLERGDMRLVEAISAFRAACEHVAEGERLLEAARVEVQRLVARPAGEDSSLTVPLSAD